MPFAFWFIFASENCHIIWDMRQLKHFLPKHSLALFSGSVGIAAAISRGYPAFLTGFLQLSFDVIIPKISRSHIFVNYSNTKRPFATFLKKKHLKDLHDVQCMIKWSWFRIGVPAEIDYVNLVEMLQPIIVWTVSKQRRPRPKHTI